jgi:hypothetical protein
LYIVYFDVVKQEISENASALDQNRAQVFRRVKDAFFRKSSLSRRAQQNDPFAMGIATGR